METIINKSIYCRRIVKTALLGLVALCGAASPLLSQETVAGKFTLSESAGFGNKFLPAGAYKFSVEPMGILQSLNSIQGARRLVQVIVRSESKSGPVAVILAMASRPAHALDSSKLVLAPVNHVLGPTGIGSGFRLVESEGQDPDACRGAGSRTGVGI
jgi:hypothetical protein